MTGSRKRGASIFAGLVLAAAAITAVLPASATAVFVPTDKDALVYESSFAAGTGAYPLALALGPNGSIYYSHSDLRNPDTNQTGNYIVSLAANGVEQSRIGDVDYNQFWWAAGIDITDDGNVVVADTANERIRIVNPVTGTEVVPSFGQYGSYAGEFSDPAGVLVGADDTLWVTDMYNNRVQHFTAEGTWLGEFPVVGISPSPDGICQDADGNLWIALTGENRIAKYATDGTLLAVIDNFTPRTAGGAPLPTETFWGPRDVEVDRWGVVYIADTNNGRIIRMLPDGTWLGTSTGSDTPSGAFSFPTDIEADMFGNIYVADSNRDALYLMHFDMADPDTVPPVTTSNISSNWTNGPVSVTLSATDASLTVEATYYSIDGTHPTLLYTGPFSISAEGTTTVKYHSIDTAQNDEDVQTRTVRIDNTDPVTTPTYQPITYGYSASVKLSVSDALSGNQNTWYSVDAGTPEIYGGNISVLGVGPHNVSFWSQDKAGNIEDIQTIFMTVLAPDIDPPVTSSNISAGWVNNNHTITLVATDYAGSAITGTFISLDGTAPTQRYTDPITVSTEGTTTVKFFSVDSFNNTETVKTALVRIDKGYPVTTHDIKDSYVDSATITFAATDAVSGVEGIRYNLDNKGWVEGNVASVPSGSWANHSIQWFAIDKAGNTQPTQSRSFTVLQPDAEPPITGDNVPSSWVRGPYNIVLTAYDEISTVAGTYYSFGGGYPSQLYNGTLAYNVEGSNQFKFHSIDSRGNVENVITKYLNIDNTPPVTSSNAQASYMGTATVTLTSSDALSGISALWHRLDGGAWVSGRSGDSVTASTTGTHTIDYYAYDLALNKETTKTATFRIVPPDSTPPVTTLTAPTGWVKGGPVSAYLSAVDASSSIGGTYFSIDGSDPQPSIEYLYYGLITVSSEGTTTIKYRSTDEWNNVEDIKTGYVRIDKTAPVTSSDATSTYVDLAEVNLAPVDPNSGVATTYYKVDGGSWKTGTQASVTGYYTHTLYYYSVDAVGNVEPTKSKTFTIRRQDRYYQSNDTNILYRGTWNSDFGGNAKSTVDAAPGSAWFYAQASQIVIASYRGPDQGIMRVSIDGGAWTYVDLYHSSQQSWVEMFNSGDLDFDYHLVKVEYTGTKNALSTGTEINLDGLRIEGNIFPVPDTAAPVTVSNVDAGWVKGPKSVTLSATDTTTGVQASYYSTDGTTPTVLYSGPVVVSGTGTTTFKFYSVDNRGNAEAIHTESIRLDNTAPATVSSVANAASFPGTATVGLTGSDPHSGVASVRWSLDGGAWNSSAANPTTITVASTALGTHTLDYFSVDALGNTEATKTVSFTVLKRYEQDDAAMVYRGGWAWAGGASRSAGGWTAASTSGSEAYFTIDGTGFDIIGSQASNYGLARLTVDGANPQLIDFYSGTTKHQQRIGYVRGLTAGRHAVKVEWTGQKNALSSGTTIGIDAVDVIGTLTSDNVAPVTTSSIDSAWRSTTQTFTLSAADANSYVANTFYRVNGGASIAYTAPVAISAEGTTTIQFWSVDAVGNVESASSASIRIDYTAPTASDDVQAQWKQGPISVTLSSADSAAGTGSLFYSLDGSYPTLPYGAGPITVSAQGSNQLKYRAVDAVGNGSGVYQTTVRVDDAAPTSSDNAPTGWVVGPVDVALGSTDALSGVSSITYSLDGGPDVAYGSPIHIAAEGVHDIAYRATDAAGNVETVRHATVRIDDTAPVTSHNAPSGWVSGPVSVSLNAADGVSGPSVTYYSIDGGAPSTLYSGPIAISAQGVTTIRFNSVDVKGNVEAVQVATVSIDDDAPVTTDDAPTGWVAAPVDLTLFPSDSISGLSRTEYRTDGGSWTDYTNALHISAEGTTTVEYRSIDVKGNVEVVRTATVRVDRTAPVTTSDALSSYNGTATVTLAAADSLSGVATTRYRINGAEWANGSQITVNGAGTYTIDWHSTDVAGNVEAVRSATFDITKRYEQTDSRVLFRGSWSNSNNAAHSAGNWKFASVAGATSYVLFDGTRIDLIGARGPSYGLAKVRIDGGDPVEIDYYAPSYQFNGVLHSFTGLAPGQHILTLEVQGAHSALSTGNFCGLDAVDVVGTLYADSTAPTSTHVAPEGWQNTTSTVTLNATDSQTWVAQTRYRINTGIQYTYAAPLAIGAEGTTTITYFSTDGAGNVEPLRTAYVRIDRTSPLTTDDAPSGWVSGAADIRLSASDALSGVGGTVYSLDDASGLPYQGPIRITSEGVHTVAYRCSDVAGNTEPTRTATVRIDNTAPTTADDAPSGWIGGTCEVTLVAQDSASGVASTSYRIAEGAWTPYTGPIAVTKPGVTTIEYRSTDAAGNTEVTKTATVRIDGEAPQTLADAPGAWTSNEVLLTLTASDAVNAISSTFIRIDGGEAQLYTGPVLFSTEGITPVEFWSVDSAGNVESPKHADIRIDRTAPHTSDDAPSVWAKDDVSLTLSASDAHAGVASTLYSLDGGASLECTGSLIISGEGTHTVEYRSVDAAGNAESTRTATVRIDRTAPTTADDVAGSYLSSATVSLTPEDGHSGVAETLWSLDGGAWYSGLTATVDTTGTHTLQFRSADNAGNVETTRSAVFTVASRFEQDAAEIGYTSTWKTSGFNGYMSGGTYRYADSAESTAVIRFTGTRLQLVTTTGSSAGIASVSIDGTNTTDVDLYSARVGYQQRVWDSGILAAGEHTATVSWTGRKNPSSSGTAIGIDAVDVAGALLQVTMEAPLNRFEQTDTHIAYSGPWTTSSNGFHSGGSYAFSQSATGTAIVRFHGDRLVLSGATNSSFGIASVTIDGSSPVDVDFYSSAIKYQQSVWDSGKLASGDHTATVTWTGRKNPASTGTAVNIDALSVGGTLLQAVPAEVFTSYEQSERRIVYEGTWGTSNNGYMSGGSYRYSSATSATATMSFIGSKFEWVTAKANSFGKALVAIDGGAPTLVDLYAPSIQYQQTVFSSGPLAEGRHTVTITNAGTRNPASSGNSVGVDRINVLGTIATVRSEQGHARIAYDGSWSTSNNGNMSGGSYAFTGTSGSANVAFRGTSIAWVTAKSSNFGKANVYLDGVQVDVVDLYSPTIQYQQTVWESAVLTDAPHTLRIEWTGTKNAASTGTFIGVDALECAGYLTPRRFEQTDVLVSQVGTWTTSTNGLMSGGSYMFANNAGAVTNLSFKGTRLDWITIKNSAMGIAHVSLDGGPAVPVDLYSATTLYNQAVWTSGTLASGTHTVSISWTGTKNAASTGTNVGVDGFDVVGSLALRRYEQTAPGITYSTGWANSNNALHSAGSYHFASSNGATATVSFHGKQLDWVTIKSPAMGIASISIDGGAPQLVDLYSAATLYQQVVWSSGLLTNGPHTVTITRTGTKNAAATNYYIGIDALDVSGVLVP